MFIELKKLAFLGNFYSGKSENSLSNKKDVEASK